jgi:hypothetical protein
MERKEVLATLVQLAKELPDGPASSTELDEMMGALRPLLRKLLSIYVVGGVRLLPPAEAVQGGDTEKEYWFAAADPELAGGLAYGTGDDLRDRIINKGTVTFEASGREQKMPMREFLKRLRQETTG